MCKGVAVITLGDEQRNHNLWSIKVENWHYKLRLYIGNSQIHMPRLLTYLSLAQTNDHMLGADQVLERRHQLVGEPISLV